MSTRLRIVGIDEQDAYQFKGPLLPMCAINDFHMKVWKNTNRQTGYVCISSVVDDRYLISELSAISFLWCYIGDSDLDTI